MQAEAPPRRDSGYRFSVLLLPVLTLSFGAQQWFVMPKSYHAYLFLSGYGMKSGQLWELFTCQLFHSSASLASGLIHLLVNLAGLWFVGRQVEAHLGSRRFILLYLTAGLTGALAQGLVAMTGFLLPESLAATADFLLARFGESVGSSNGLCGVFAVFCLWKRKAALGLLGLALFASAVLIVVPSDPSLAHVGHFVALLTGIIGFKFWTRPAAPNPTASRAA